MKLSDPSLLLMSLVILSTGCSTLYAPATECIRPNLVQKTSWKILLHDHWKDPLYKPGLDWAMAVFQYDCFPDEAEEAREAAKKEAAKR